MSKKAPTMSHTVEQRAFYRKEKARKKKDQFMKKAMNATLAHLRFDPFSMHTISKLLKS